MMRPRPARLLVLDADPGAVRLIRHALEGEHRVVGASGEADALRRLTTGRFDLVISDLRSADLLRRLHGRPDPPPVLLVTGHPGAAEAARALGAAAWIPKPYSLRCLTREVGKLLSSPRPPRPPHAVEFRRSGGGAMRPAARFLADGLERGERVVAITDDRSWAELGRLLGEAGHDAGRLVAAGRIRRVDGGELLERVLRDGMPDERAFREQVQLLFAGAPGLRVYGDAVGLLARRGRHGAALALEECWNRLRRERDFTLT